jgi:AraC-like DNA-binding protein
MMNILFCLSKLFKAAFVDSKSDKRELTFKKRFCGHFFKERYYIHANGSLQKLAFILNVSEDYLNNHVLTNYQMDFSALCNKHRIEHFQAAMEDPSNSDIPISCLIMGSGFESAENFTISLQSDKPS